MTLAEINADITSYQAARDAILQRGAKEYAINGRQFSALDLPFIEDRLSMLRSARDRATAGSVRVAQFRDPE